MGAHWPVSLDTWWASDRACSSAGGHVIGHQSCFFTLCFFSFRQRSLCYYHGINLPNDCSPRPFTENLTDPLTSTIYVFTGMVVASEVLLCLPFSAPLSSRLCSFLTLRMLLRSAPFQHRPGPCWLEEKKPKVQISSSSSSIMVQLRRHISTTVFFCFLGLRAYFLSSFLTFLHLTLMLTSPLATSLSVISVLFHSQPINVTDHHVPFTFIINIF